MNYGNHFAIRKPSSQVWAVGNQVKVGFLSLRIVGGSAGAGWQLTNKEETKQYLFTPHRGIAAL